MSTQVRSRRTMAYGIAFLRALAALIRHLSTALGQIKSRHKQLTTLRASKGQGHVSLHVLSARAVTSSPRDLVPFFILCLQVAVGNAVGHKLVRDDNSGHLANEDETEDLFVKLRLVNEQHGLAAADVKASPITITDLALMCTVGEEDPTRVRKELVIEAVAVALSSDPRSNHGVQWLSAESAERICIWHRRAGRTQRHSRATNIRSTCSCIVTALIFGRPRCALHVAYVSLGPNEIGEIELQLIGQLILPIVMLKMGYRRKDVHGAFAGDSSSGRTVTWHTLWNGIQPWLHPR
mmetsp:Transcript_31079/g.68132  ORF Transcript_31079/g.68132 Transcript_31079/m.68132 type:complete len:294 (-) Transcript_31079:256-1137(-)